MNPLSRFRDPKGRQLLILGTVLLLLLLFLIGWIIHSNRTPVLTEVVISAEGLPEAFDGLRIVQVSDLHDAEYGEDHEKTVSLIRRAEPHIILLTGDLLDSRRTNVERTVSFVRQAAEIAPCYYVTGNHEGRLTSEDYAAFEEALLSLGVTVLHGESVTLEREGETITVAGIDSPLFRHSGHGTPDLSVLCKDGYTILLAHHPEFVADYAQAGADLVFSGHVHGGQFRLPLVGGLYGPGQGLFPTYDAGLYGVSVDGHEILLYVHRGLGNSRFPIRLWNRPEVVLAVLEAKS